MGRSPSVPSTEPAPSGASQFGQDVYLDRFVFCGRRDGVFVDLGGFDGVIGSNTLIFERDRGWTGVLVEPDPDLHARASANRSCSCVRAAITANDGTAPFWRPIKSERRMMGGLVDTFRADYRTLMRSEIDHAEETIEVDTVSPRSLLQRCGIHHIDLVSLDIEGAERTVLAAFPFDEVTVHAWTIENLEGSDDIRQLMERRGYALVRRLGVDEVYVPAAEAYAVRARAAVDPFDEAVELLAAGCFANAAAANEALLRTEPLDPDVWNNLGLSLAGIGLDLDALDAHGRALELDPDRGSHRRNLQRALLRVGRAAEARAVGEQATHPPTDADVALVAQAAFEVAYRAGATADAIGAADRWYAASATPQARLARGEARLAALHLAEGWADYEARSPERRDTVPEQVRELPEWQGEPLDGRRLLVVGEQGLGDQVFFSRFLPAVRNRVDDFAVLVAAPLTRLFESLGVPVLPFTPELDLGAFDCRVRIGSLAHLTPLTSVVAPPTLDLPTDSRARATALLGEPDGRHRRAGLAWSGVSDTFHQRSRHVPLDRLRPLLDLPDVEWFSLMKGPAAEEIDACGFGDRLSDASSSDRDLADTAALCASFDFVVTVCTVTAHVAGTIGVPTWVLLHERPFWVWGHERSTCPWYPSVRILRQERAGDWTPVIDRLAAALTEEHAT